MTATYQLPTDHTFKVRFRSKPVQARKIHAIIPTYKDWDGLRETLDSLNKLKTPPARITVVNDNENKTAPEWLAEYRGDLVSYPGNRGPAYARNAGFGFRKERPDMENIHVFSLAIKGQAVPHYLKQGHDPRLKYNLYTPREFTWEHEIDWFYFTDCGCRHSPDIFLDFEKTWRDVGDSCVAISGPVTGDGDEPINKFMTEQAILNPPKEQFIRDSHIPQAIVTANALVAGIAFSFVGGFDENFPEAAGEDLDLGMRLTPLGMIGWAESASVSHRFAEDRADFYRRFRRYGRGNRLLELKHNLPSLRARNYRAELPELQELADYQVEAMQAGYDEAVDATQQGKIVITET
jgi:GT2 family glycosyltransferase